MPARISSSRTKFTWQVREGFRKDADSSQRFQGPPVSRLIRYELKGGKGILRAGCTLECDPGEPLVWNKLRKGFNSSSAFLEMRDKGLLQGTSSQVIPLCSGCGLVAGTGRKSKSSDVILKEKFQCRPVSLGCQIGIDRGLAAMFTHGNWNARMMLSAVKTSANTEIMGDSAEVFTALNLSGLFRNEEENAFGHNLKEKQAGASFGYSTGKFSLDYNVMSQFLTKHTGTDRARPVSATAMRRIFIARHSTTLFETAES